MKTKVIITSILILILALIAIEQGIKKDYAKDVKIDDTATSTMPIVTTPGSGSYTFEPVVVPTNIKKPSLARKVLIPPIFEGQARENIMAKIATTTELLKKNPDSIDDWISLAIHRSTISDHEGALEIWKYISVLYPEDFLSRLNMASIYHLYLKKYDLAEKYYLEAIAITPTKASIYIDLHRLYKYSYKTNTDNAEAVLLKGIEKDTFNTDLYTTLALYYKEKNDVINAHKYYSEALDIAKKVGNIRLAELLESEIKLLEK